jgi:hypothetical protein
MSNNGQGLWASLLHNQGRAFRSRVAAIVYDCAAAHESAKKEPTDPVVTNHRIDPEHRTRVISSTVLMALLAIDIRVRNPAHSASRDEGQGNEAPPILTRNGIREPLNAASRLHAERCGESFFWAERLSLDGASVFECDAKTSPPVPTLCLTSAQDAIILPEAVEAWAAYLRENRPNRDVRLHRVRGTHCMLHLTDYDAYAAHIKALIEDAAVARRDAPIRLGVNTAVDVSDGADGGETATPLGVFLQTAGLDALLSLEGLRVLGLDGLCRLCREAGRTALLARLKQEGVSSLGERQRLANALGKHLRETGGE